MMRRICSPINKLKDVKLDMMNIHVLEKINPRSAVIIVNLNARKRTWLEGSYDDCAATSACRVETDKYRTKGSQDMEIRYFFFIYGGVVVLDNYIYVFLV